LVSCADVRDSGGGEWVMGSGIGELVELDF
jgi:hypothetical protein